MGFFVGFCFTADAIYRHTHPKLQASDSGVLENVNLLIVF